MTEQSGTAPDAGGNSTKLSHIKLARFMPSKQLFNTPAPLKGITATP